MLPGQLEQRVQTDLTTTGYTLHNWRNNPGIFAEGGVVGGDITSVISSLTTNARSFTVFEHETTRILTGSAAVLAAKEAQAAFDIFNVSGGSSPPPGVATITSVVASPSSGTFGSREIL